jgi:uncharacterized protein YuzE
VTEEKLQPCYVHLRDLREGETVFRTIEMDDDDQAGIKFDVDENYRIIGVEFDHIVDVEINGLSIRDDTSL